MRKLLLALVFVLLARPALAQDMEAMARWTSYQIVHYKIVGEFSGETILIRGSDSSGFNMVTARVTDRFEVEFDWDQQEFNIVGKPVIRNFPTKIVSIDLDIESHDAGKVFHFKCPEPKLSGALEQLTGLALKADEGMRMSGFVTLEARRDQPGGSFASFSDDPRKPPQCGDVWKTAKAVSETTPMTLTAVPGMFLAMPIPDDKGMKITADKKSIVIPPGVKDSANYGWTYTITPTPVK
jgi:hypothetical protein